MRYVLCRRLLTGLLLGAIGWAAPAVAQATAAGSPPAPDAVASVGRFVALCETKLQLAPEQATALHTYLDQEVNYLTVVALNGLEPTTPDLAPTEVQQFDQVMAHLLSASQLKQFRQLQQTPQAQTYLHSMALLPADAMASTAKTKQHQRRKGAMLAQRLDAEE